MALISAIQQHAVANKEEPIELTGGVTEVFAGHDVSGGAPQWP